MLGDDTIDLRAPKPIPEVPEDILEELQEWYPAERPQPSAGTFEIGLVLAGAVSAGAYTAGVMDFLFEALDEWYRLRNDDACGAELPNHDVVVRVISGASAGGINGAIAATACRYRFPPVTLASDEERRQANPFYDTWVNRIDIARLLDTSDLDGDGAAIGSLLNSESLDEMALGIVAMTGDTDADQTSRPWLEDPFKLLLTVTNLAGVPYRIRFTGAKSLSHEMVMHRDHVGFLVPALTNSISSPAPPPDLVPLAPVNSDQAAGWQQLAATALASGAFPIALAARSLSRPGSDYDYRFVFPRADRNVVYSKPAIDRADVYRFNAVDGGAMNNEPFELARVELAGLKARNPRRGRDAHRAVIMVDPFTDPQPNLPTPDRSLWATFAGLLKAFKAQTRFHQIDLTLAEAGDVYSRFMIAPSRNDVRGSGAIASGGLRGFLGFFCKDYRLHDYMLGRANCESFLREWFVLPSAHTTTGEHSERSNSLFQHWPQAALDDDTYKSCRRKGHRQIIPLVGTAAEAQELPSWPAGRFSGYDSLERDIKKRIDACYPSLADQLVKAFCQGTSTFSFACGPLTYVAAWLAWKLRLRRKLRDKLKNWIDAARDEVDERGQDFANNDGQEPRPPDALATGSRPLARRP